MNTNNVNFLIGGKLGDFLLALYGVRGYCESNNKKATIYMIDIGWDFGINNTYEALKNIILNQVYVNDFKILNKEDYYLDPIQTPSKNSPIIIYNKNLLKEGYISNDYLNSPYLYKKCWPIIFSHLYNFNIKKPTIWIKYDQIDNKFKNKIIIHRKYAPERFNNQFPYELIIEKYKDNIIFVSTTINDYEKFPYKNNIEFHQIKNIEEWFTIINSCSIFVGNLTAPIVIADSMNKLRIVELPHNEDAYHWIGAEQYSDTIKWFLTDQYHNLN
jgi:hypothetical protein